MNPKPLVITLGAIIVALLIALVFIPSPRTNTPPSVASSTPENPQPVISPDQHVEVGAPLSGETISSPARISGNVTGGGWFFEASFPVRVVDADGTVLGQGQARALSDWMSTDSVPFAATVPFQKSHSLTGAIVLSKDNPSGDPAQAMSFTVPVLFATSSAETGAVGTIEGSVLIRPTCPVERIPPDPQCAPRPYATLIGVSRNIENPVAFETVQSNASGSFRFVLPAGEYDFFHPQGTSPYPRCEEKVITVQAGQTNQITISCDSGIR